jgi:hypothetical protein
VIWNEANVEAPSQTGVVTLLSVTDGRGVTVNVTLPLTVFGPHDGAPFVAILTKSYSSV